jgi:hypothetical protein
METKRAYAIPILLAVVVLVVVPLSAYIGSYLWFGDYSLLTDVNVNRDYGHRWQTSLFAPLGEAEEFITGRHVHLSHRVTAEESEELQRQIRRQNGHPDPDYK